MTIFLTHVCDDIVHHDKQLSTVNNIGAFVLVTSLILSQYEKKMFSRRNMQDGQCPLGGHLEKAMKTGSFLDIIPLIVIFNLSNKDLIVVFRRTTLTQKALRLSDVR